MGKYGVGYAENCDGGVAFCSVCQEEISGFAGSFLMVIDSNAIDYGKKFGVACGCAKDQLLTIQGDVSDLAIELDVDLA